MPTAEIATPYNPPNLKARIIAKAIVNIGTTVDHIPTPSPAIMLVAAPVLEASAIPIVGL